MGLKKCKEAIETDYTHYVCVVKNVKHGNYSNSKSHQALPNGKG